MGARKPDVESRAEAILRRIQRHNLGVDTLAASEVRSLLEEIRAIGKLNLAGSLPSDVLTRVGRIMQHAVQEASIIVAGASGRDAKNQTD